MDAKMPIGLEIERRFLIERPDVGMLAVRYGARVLEIIQTYLLTPSGYSSERVRCTVDSDGTTYTHTRKRRIARESAIEEEEAVDEARYRALLLFADPERSAIRKRRITFFWRGQCYEIDLYPFFGRLAILETELRDAGDALIFPPELTVLREITGIPSLSNHALARQVPSEASLLE